MAKITAEICDNPTFVLNKVELVQSYSVRMPFLLPTSRNHLLDLILSLTTKTREHGEGASLPLYWLSKASTPSSQSTIQSVEIVLYFVQCTYITGYFTEDFPRRSADSFS